MKTSSFNRQSPCTSSRVMIRRCNRPCIKSATVYKNVLLPLALMLLMLFFGLSIPNAQAANWYVRSGATGSNNGSDWINAWRDFNQITGISAGDTVWISGGTYSASLVPATSGTAASRIYYKRVRSTDSVPTSASGWSSSYDSQVILAGSSIAFGAGNTGIHHVTIDGQVDNGIKVTASDTDFGAGVILNNASGDSITIQYIDIAGKAGDSAYTFSNDASSLYIAGSSNLTIRYCRIHGSVNLVKLGPVTNAVFEYNRFYNNLVANPATWHPNMITSFGGGSSVTFRYNETYNWHVEGIMIYGSTQTWTIYGNIWHDPYGGQGVNRIVEVQDNSNHNVYFYNNTIVGAWVGLRTANNGSYSGSSAAKNNIFWNTRSPGGTGKNDDYNFSDKSINGSHSISGGSNPFIGSGNLHILCSIGALCPRNKGVTLGSIYSTDMDGNARGGDGIWDIGAFERSSATCRQPDPPCGGQIRRQ